MFSEKDLQQIQDKGLTVEKVEEQIRRFREGFPHLKLEKIAATDDGIMQLDGKALSKYEGQFSEQRSNRKLLKFVPASGAASRMFKKLYAFMDEFEGSEEDFKKLEKDKSLQSVYYFFEHLDQFAFYDDLKETLAGRNQDLEQLRSERNYLLILGALMDEDGMNYGNLPKGLLKFHQYNGSSRTPVEEHLVEGAHYCKGKGDKVYLHFTVSPEHRSDFKTHVEQVKSVYEEKFKVEYEITFSEQKPSTDTIAVDMNNKPFREPDGSILFRPGGHGALLENLNDIDADAVFIKNIDNVVPNRLKTETYLYKKVLAGILFHYQNRIFNHIKVLNSGSLPMGIIDELSIFLKNELCILPPLEFSRMNKEEKISYFLRKLNRPTRVCGMVENVGEPGGGPFWARNPDGSVSLQIIETSQMNLDNPEQRKLFEESTHFSPTDIVCGLKNFQGEKFDLRKFRDEETGFIAKKSKDGKELKALELPGLWNGSMSDWNTIFVEVPIITFNPVKTVNDLLREQHLNK